MKIIKFSQARDRLRRVLDTCSETGEPVCIQSVKNQMIIISKDKFDSMEKQIKDKESKCE